MNRGRLFVDFASTRPRDVALQFVDVTRQCGDAQAFP